MSPPLLETYLCLSYVCNMHCRAQYCHLQELQDVAVRSMPRPTAIKGVDFFVNAMKVSGTPKGSLFLFGGETLLQYGLVRDILMHLVKSYTHLVEEKRITVNIVTNGLLLDLEKFIELTSLNLKYKCRDFVRIAVSYDGDPLAQNINRRDSCSVEHNLNNIKQYYSGLPEREKEFRRLYLLWTLTPAGASLLTKGFQHLFEIIEINKFVHSLTIKLAYCIDWPSSVCVRIRKEVRTALRYMYHNNLYSSNLIIKPPFNFSRHIKTWRELYLDPCQDPERLTCVNPLFNILPDGEIVRCNVTFIHDIFKNYRPLSAGNVNSLKQSPEAIRGVFQKMKKLFHMTLLEASTFLKNREASFRFKKSFLIESNKVCLFRYSSPRYLKNYYHAQRAFLEEITKCNNALKVS